LSEEKSKPSMEEIIEGWQQRHGYRFYDREPQLIDLYNTFKFHGYTKEEVGRIKIQNLIHKCMYLETWHKAKGWKKAAAFDLKLVHNSPSTWEETDGIFPGDYDSSARLDKTSTIRESVLNPVEPTPDEMIDLAKTREGLEAMPLEKDALLAELGIKKDGRRE
jgi:hypothetical protein